MYIIDGIAYAGEPKEPLSVCGIRALDGHRLWARFSTGEAKEIDFRPMLDYPAFSPLKDEAAFKTVYIDYGVPVWCDGDIDMVPEALYEMASNGKEGDGDA